MTSLRRARIFHGFHGVLFPWGVFFLPELRRTAEKGTRIPGKREPFGCSPSAPLPADLLDGTKFPTPISGKSLRFMPPPTCRPIRTGLPNIYSTLEWIRTTDLRFRKPPLYPLSYEGKSWKERFSLPKASTGGNPAASSPAFAFGGHSYRGTSSRIRPQRERDTVSPLAPCRCDGLLRGCSGSGEFGDRQRFATFQGRFVGNDSGHAHGHGLVDIAGRRAVLDNGHDEIVGQVSVGAAVAARRHLRR